MVTETDDDSKYNFVPKFIVQVGRNRALVLTMNLRRIFSDVTCSGTDGKF